MTDNLAIAISAFRSDEPVIALLQAIFNTSHPAVKRVIVVDSLGSGAISKAVTTNGWPVVYESSDRNLGSAGNLARRIALAKELGAEWCLCLNHDANWSADRLTAMLTVATSEPRVGAVYPILDHSPRERPWEDGRRSFEPSARKRFADMPVGSGNREVLWSSSNGALYATAPLADGISVMENLWMGYEDLAYGIGMSLGGWKQLMCREAVLSNVFDYRPESFLGQELHVPDKPTWYAYYDIRNLILIRKKYGAAGVSMRSIFVKFVRSILRIALIDNHKVERFSMLFAGVISGILGKDGKWTKP